MEIDVGSAEFVNAFIKKQRELIEELTAQKLICETKYLLAEEIVKNLQEVNKKLLEAKSEKPPKEKKNPQQPDEF